MSRSRRFHALYDRIYRDDVLWEAWRRVQKNRGAAGVDGETIEAIEQTGATKWLGELAADLREGLECGVMENWTIRETIAGTPQGGVISPLLANIYLHAFDRAWQAEGAHLGVLVRYADDFVILCRQESAAKAALPKAREILARLRLELNPDKTRLVDVRYGRASFNVLGCTFRKRCSILRRPDRHFMQRCPSPRAMKRIREKIHEQTCASRSGVKDVKKIIETLNPILRGWGNYFKTGNADKNFNQIDHYVRARIVRWLWRRGGQRPRFRASKWPHERLYEMGLHQLRTNVCYPAQATPPRPSVSRVRENRTHGLKGGPGQQGGAPPRKS